VGKVVEVVEGIEACDQHHLDHLDDIDDLDLGTGNAPQEQSRAQGGTTPDAVCPSVS
jgi:hypothetical protein